MEKTLLLIKPDAIQRGIIGEIISRFEKKGLKLVGMKMIQLNDKLLNDHYSHLVEKPFFERIKKFMKSTPVIACCWEGADSVSVVRKMCGITKSREAEIGTLRGDLGLSVQANLVHASDTKENAKIELFRFFKKDELFQYNQILDVYLYSEDELVDDNL